MDTQRNSTRFKDANGREIFEGDILECLDEPVKDTMVWDAEFQYHLAVNFSNTQDELSDWVVVGEASEQKPGSFAKYFNPSIMSIKLKKGINPIGQKVLVKTQISGTITWHEYKVHTVTGADENVPNPDGPIIHMKLNEKNGISLQQYVSMPLSAFPGLCQSSGVAFWESGKTVVE